MKLRSALLALAVVVVAAGAVAVLGNRQGPADAKMVVAGQKFLASLDDKQKARATFAFDSPERTNWWFVPREDGKQNSIRKGLPLQDMTDAQKKAALDLLATGTSVKGLEQARTIMSLEAILREQEANKKGTPVRNPEWYFFTVFGTPAMKGKWGWRVEGHHLSVNFTVEDGVVTSATPFVFGANPAQVKSGAKKGERILPEVEDFAKDLFKSLDDDQRKVAFQQKPFPEPEQNTVAPKKLGAPVGLAAAKMNEKQRVTLIKLLEAYATRMAPDVAIREMKDVRANGIDKIHFAYSGSTEAGKGYTYRVHGPSFVIEFLNMQADSAGNVANHIHSSWRRTDGDFGLKGKQ
jgi:hypothetical protein